MARRIAAAVVMAIGAAGVLATAGAAWASGVAGSIPWYVDRFGGEPKDLKALYDGRLGIVQARAPKPQLYMAWRLLHGQRVGQAAGEKLAFPCCDVGREHLWADPKGETGSSQWLAARKLVPDAPKKAYTPQGDEAPYYMWSQACFDDAFRNAAVTLKARVAKYGAASPWTRAWLDTQDAVFAQCRGDTPLPALAGDAPGWLKADYAYQVAAHALYAGRTSAAADGFAAIARDRGSPWQPMGTYLKARTLRRAALGDPTAQNFTLARVAIAELSRMPSGTFGREEVRPMLRSLAFRDRPKALAAELGQELNDPTPSADLAVAFRDAVSLANAGQPKPEVLDWMATMRPVVSDTTGAEVGWKPAEMQRLQRDARLKSLANAQERWRATKDRAWLVAALSLVDPGEAQAGGLIAAGNAVPAGDPAALTAQFHVVRLTIGSADPAATRARLDAILARRDLSTSDRNIFLAQRTQVAADAADFVRHALRTRLCVETAYMDGVAQSGNGCPRNDWLPAYVPDRSVYDGIGDEGTVGLGEDARAIIDRLPLAQRIAVSRSPGLPGQLRLDIAITSYARAVLLQDHAAVDGLAGDLAKLLPQMAPEWKRIRETPVGPAKRFAEHFVLAKIPGVRTDLVEYTRPEGTVAQFQSHWVSWTLVAKGKPVTVSPPALALYQQDGSGAEYSDPDPLTDLSCLGGCAVAAAPLRLPDFAAAGQRQALTERGYFFADAAAGYAETPKPLPTGVVSVWDEMLAYARANPKDAQVPEALYWINRAGRWGGSYQRSGKRAFELLHARYAQSTWAKRSPYYYD